MLEEKHLVFSKKNKIGGFSVKSLLTNSKTAPIHVKKGGNGLLSENNEENNKNQHNERGRSLPTKPACN